jgi:hypothetical protein
MNVIIENPLILILGAVFSVIPFKNRCRVTAVQKLVLFYLACVLINLVSNNYFKISAWQWSLNISWSVLGVVFLSGLFFWKNKALTDNDRRLSRQILNSWWIILGIIAGHMAVLFLMLNRFYGYGYERDFKIMGTVSGFFILFICMWPSLASRPVRCCLAAGFAAGVVIICKGQVL